jgi:nicotinate-nucleotide adenylyltransferase
MNIGILGGTFNPIHNGHLFLAEELLCSFALDKIVFIPANIPAHKAEPADTEPAQRLAMVKSAVSPYKEFDYDDCEIERGGVSYTIDTVTRLIKKYRLSEKPVLVIGDDLIKSFPTWREAQKLAQITQLIVAHRRYTEEQPLIYPHKYLANLMLPISSSDIRNRIRQHRAYRFLIPESVFTYIKENGLYK